MSGGEVDFELAGGHGDNQAFGPVRITCHTCLPVHVGLGHGDCDLVKIERPILPMENPF